VHRIGRTGRAGRTGTAISLVNAADRAQVRSIERYTAQRIPVEQIAGLEPTLRMHSGNPSGPGGRPSGKRPGGNSGGRRFNNGPSRGGRR
jgi:superfamily II DNA/RNA helicase